MRCDECRYWKYDELHYENWYKLFGKCEVIEHPEEIRDRVDKSISRDIDWPMHQKAFETAMKCKGAYVVDASDYKATLYTKADFFCAMFESKL